MDHPSYPHSKLCRENWRPSEVLEYWFRKDLPTMKMATNSNKNAYSRKVFYRWLERLQIGVTTFVWQLWCDHLNPLIPKNMALVCCHFHRWKIFPKPTFQNFWGAPIFSAFYLCLCLCLHMNNGCHEPMDISAYIHQHRVFKPVHSKTITGQFGAPW